MTFRFKKSVDGVTFSGRGEVEKRLHGAKQQHDLSALDRLLWHSTGMQLYVAWSKFVDSHSRLVLHY